MTPELRRVTRLDSVPLTRAYYTDEGYLKDKPILTSTGIFEYMNSDGSVRKELRLPEDVFDPESLASFEGKPIIISHNAGLVDKDNVHENQVGTILTEGFQDGNDVRAKIIIHDTDEMKRCGLKELSLGYNLDLEEEPGEWNGMHYDAIQRNIRINHLALVRDARAGEQARLNIDSKDGETLIGGKLMGKIRENVLRKDEALSPEELQNAIEWYTKNRGRLAGEEVADNDEPVEAQEVEEVKTEEPAEETVESVVGEEPKEDANKEEPVEEVKSEEVVEEVAPVAETEEVPAVEPVQTEEAPTEEEEKPEFDNDADAVIKDQDKDIKTLLDIIDTLLAEKAFNEAEVQTDSADCEEKEVVEEEDFNLDDDFDDENVEETTADPVADDEDVVEEKTENDPDFKMDSVDELVHTRVKLGMLGRSVNMDGLEDMDVFEAKKMIIKAVRPSVHLDGKSATYIDAMFDLAEEEVKKNAWKGTDYQRRQMFNKDSAVDNTTPSSNDARKRMIERMYNKEVK